MKRVITYGSFDLLHYGHIELLRRAKEMGDYLIVALSTDEFSASKGRRAYFSFDQRKAMLEAIRYVDLVVPEQTWGQKSQDIDEYGIDVFVIGDDWIDTFNEQLEGRCEIVYLPRTLEIDSLRMQECRDAEEARGL
ncbi:glycerol-3-phosphate cytidylyltransferase [Actinomyces naeslundii]|uniref:glycerol-3-phosphate cytidylyltransferase n=1 Tax=Actinomyces naeslundii TaxID=1655 RepID=UPI00094D1724|nr:glycerol-3-phosphate cytidylyltransferase [Actinomyces naeslundii]OLO89613.1 glycerol-3-phosphate cytidylyltransferase [Actinomyces naeslundii]